MSANLDTPTEFLRTLHKSDFHGLGMEQSSPASPQDLTQLIDDAINWIKGMGGDKYQLPSELVNEFAIEREKLADISLHTLHQRIAGLTEIAIIRDMVVERILGSITPEYLCSLTFQQRFTLKARLDGLIERDIQMLAHALPLEKSSTTSLAG